ncbi:GDP-L-fucose synthase [Mesoterricola silvestris]|uniref:GDP-L-fucose synthase n=2 Tax=Mesoterricola silvestris TaxID=2927979 RepID=A0AA48K7G3_9BACT|nr:GDP-L-fucose synthase [Mesoterricola silvestris]
MADPVGFLLENLDMGRNLVWGARNAGIPRLLNLGSSCMYPRNISEPLREEMVLKGELEPTNEGYALAKVTTARLCEYITRAEPKFQYKTFIPCNLYGRHDKFDAFAAHLIPAVIRKVDEAVRTDAEVITIWGDGTARREFMYAGDMADALIQGVERFDALPETMNVGLGTDWSVNEYYEAVADVMGYRGRFDHDLTKPVGMARKLVSTERLEAWGWRAGTSLRDGVQKTVDFFKKEWQG